MTLALRDRYLGSGFTPVPITCMSESGVHSIPSSVPWLATLLFTWSPNFSEMMIYNKIS